MGRGRSSDSTGAVTVVSPVKAVVDAGTADRGALPLEFGAALPGFGLRGFLAIVFLEIVNFDRQIILANAVRKLQECGEWHGSSRKLRQIQPIQYSNQRGLFGEVVDNDL